MFGHLQSRAGCDYTQQRSLSFVILSRDKLVMELRRRQCSFYRAEQEGVALQAQWEALDHVFEVPHLPIALA